MEQRLSDLAQTSVPSELLSSGMHPAPPPAVSQRTTSITPFPPTEWSSTKRVNPPDFPPPAWVPEPYKPERYSEPNTEPLIRVESAVHPTRTRSNTSDLIRLNSTSEDSQSSQGFNFSIFLYSGPDPGNGNGTGRLLEHLMLELF